jgi:hypothetical protein
MRRRVWARELEGREMARERIFRSLKVASLLNTCA